MVAAVWTPPEEPKLERPESFHIVGTAGIFAPLAPVNWICQSLYIAPGPPTLFVGYGSSGKSMAVQTMALAIACGGTLWGRFAVRKGRVLHLDYEQGGRLTRDRYRRMAVYMRLHPDHLEERLELGVLPSEGLDKDKLSMLATNRDLIIVDSWRASHQSVDENSSAVRGSLDDMCKVSEVTGCTFIVLHHSRKPSNGESSTNKYGIRGSGGFFDGSQTLFLFEKDEKAKEPGKSVAIVKLERERITGKEGSEFRLAITDEDDGQSLAVTWGQQEVKESKSIERIKGDVVKLLTHEYELTSMNKVVDLIVGDKGDKLTAVRELIGSHTITLHKGCYRLSADVSV